jgi:hypothetical protein
VRVVTEIPTPSLMTRVALTFPSAISAVRFRAGVAVMGMLLVLHSNSSVGLDSWLL